MNTNSHWRDSARIPRFFGISGESIFPILLFLLHIRLSTFILCCILILFFSFLERFGFTLPIFLRWFRSFLAGPRRSSKHWWHPL